MGKIYMIMGKSGCGKDTVMRGIIAINKNIFPIIPYTTRSKRKGEVDGVEYYFKNDRHFTESMLAGKIIEHRTYHKTTGDVHYYTLHDEQFKQLESCDCIVIGTLDVYKSYAQHFGKDVVIPIYINVPELLRLERLLNREKVERKPDVIEICRRLVDDNKEFSYHELIKYPEIIVVENYNLNNVINYINTLIAYPGYYNPFTITSYNEDLLLYGRSD